MEEVYLQRGGKEEEWDDSNPEELIIKVVKQNLVHKFCIVIQKVENDSIELQTVSPRPDHESFIP